MHCLSASNVLLFSQIDERFRRKQEIRNNEILDLFARNNGKTGNFYTVQMESDIPRYFFHQRSFNRFGQMCRKNSAQITGEKSHRRRSPRLYSNRSTRFLNRSQNFCEQRRKFLVWRATSCKVSSSFNATQAEYSCFSLFLFYSIIFHSLNLFEQLF